LGGDLTMLGFSSDCQINPEQISKLSSLTHDISYLLIKNNCKYPLIVAHIFE
jgi:hypothetical protein